MSGSDIQNLEQFRHLDDAQFESLYRISQILNRVTGQDTLIAEALTLVISVLQAERGLCVRYRPGEQPFTIIAARNFKSEEISDLSGFSSGILQRVVQEAKPCLIHDVRSDPDVSQFDSVLIHQINSVIGVPVSYDGQIWGVLLVDSRENRREFTEDNLRFLSFFSNMVSLALDKIIRYEALEKENRQLRKRLAGKGIIPDMIGESKAMRQLAGLIHRVAASDATVLLLGESGTGKDLAARAIHQLSGRKEKPYLAQFCGSIPDTLLESELFGYKKGAFSGANSDKKGLFEVADGGTFFLDEIADISLALQAKLLRVLQNQEIMPLGGTSVKKVNLRILAASNKDLAALAESGDFREDLFYRLNVFPITVPPLRERREDIALLSAHFIGLYGRNDIQLDSGALAKLHRHSWPGNVRQLENVLQRALILCDGHRILAEHILLENEKEVDPRRFEGSLKDLEKQVLRARLKKYDGNRTKTAQSLGVSVRWVQLKLKEIGESGQDESGADHESS